MGGGCPTARRASGAQDPILVQPIQHLQERVVAWGLEVERKTARLDLGKESARSVRAVNKREH